MRFKIESRKQQIIQDSVGSKRPNARHHPPASNYEQHPILRMTSTLERVGWMPMLDGGARARRERPAKRTSLALPLPMRRDKPGQITQESRDATARAARPKGKRSRMQPSTCGATFNARINPRRASSILSNRRKR